MTKIDMTDWTIETKRLFVNKELASLTFEQERIRDEWVKNKRCNCILKPGKILVCIHVEKEIHNKLYKRRREVLDLSQSILMEELVILRRQKDVHGIMTGI